MRTRPFFTRSLATVLVSAQLSGCTRWRVEPLSPADVVARQQPSEVRVRLPDGSHERLYRPEIRGDTLLGRRNVNATQPDRALRLADVKEIATSRVDGAGTAVLVVGVAIVGLIAAAQSIRMSLGGLGGTTAE